jgi:hypothetical protein
LKEQSLRIRGLIKEILDDPVAPQAVQRYFTESDQFAGATFNTIGTNDPDAINEDDLLAVHLLGGMSFKPLTVRALLCPGVTREEVRRLLRRISTSVCLWEPAAARVLEGPALELWRTLKGLDNIGPVKAGKLLARKRPRLLPIYDKVIEKYFSPPPDRFWETLHEALREEGLPGRVDAILRPGILKGDDRVTTIRLLDAAVWMKGKRNRPY